MFRTTTAIVLAVTLTACSQLDIKKAAPPAPGKLLAQAKAQRAAGNLGGAVTTLSHASGLYPKNTKVRQALKLARNAWQRKRQELEDRLLLVRMESLRQEIPLQAKLARSNPDDLTLKERHERLRLQFARGAGPLADCGQRHARANPSLAKNCLRLSLEIREDPVTRKLLNEVESRLQATRKTEQRQTQERRQQSQLSRAKALAVKGNIYTALYLLEQLLAEQPDEPAAKKLAATLQTQLKQITSSLLSAGDALYREGQIKAAVTLWQAALTLNPESEQAKRKLERGQHVAKKLKQLRQGQEPPVQDHSNQEHTHTEDDASKTDTPH